MGSELGDKALALLAANGDADAFRQLLERHYDRIFRIAYRFLGHREGAEDITQDICVSLPARLKSFRGEAAFSTWLYRLVGNRVKDELRKLASHARAHETYSQIEDLRRAEDADTRAELEWLQDLMTSLPEDLRETAILIVGEGMSQGEAAEVLGIKEGTVAWRMSELKKALRELAREEA